MLKKIFKCPILDLHCIKGNAIKTHHSKNILFLKFKATKFIVFIILHIQQIDLSQTGLPNTSSSSLKGGPAKHIFDLDNLQFKKLPWLPRVYGT